MATVMVSYTSQEVAQILAEYTSRILDREFKSGQVDFIVGSNDTGPCFKGARASVDSVVASSSKTELVLR